MCRAIQFDAESDVCYILVDAGVSIPSWSVGFQYGDIEYLGSAASGPVVDVAGAFLGDCYVKSNAGEFCVAGLGVRIAGTSPRTHTLSRTHTRARIRSQIGLTAL